MCVHCKSLQSCPTLVAPWTVTRQAPLSMGFSRQEYWSGLPFPSPGDLPDPGIKPTCLLSPALAGGFFTPNATWQTPIFVYFRKIFISPLFEEQFCHLQYMYFVVIFLSILWFIIPLSPGLQDFCREKCIYTISGFPKFVMCHFSHVILKILSLFLTI